MELNNLILDFEGFRKHFQINHISFDDFINKAHTNRGILIKDWLNNFKEDDLRKQNKDEILNNLYKIMVTEVEENLLRWFNDHISINNVDKFFNIKIDNEILFENILKGRTNNLTRIIKNISFYEIYNTPKIHFNTKPTLYLTLKAFFEDFCLPRCCGLPMGIKKILNHDVGSLYAIMRGTECKASVFNPYTALYIFEKIFKAKKIFTPVLDWNSYLIGFLNSTAEEYVGVDVIPTIVEQAKTISSNFQNKETFFYCCPSEKLENNYDILKYHNYFDTIFFSPPYFDLEKYNSSEQSFKNYENYDLWLENYWRKTCILCQKLLSKDGHFGFVVSDYKNKNWIYLSNDLLKIAQEYFDLDKQYLLGWNSFKMLDSEKMKNGNFENFYFMKSK